MNEFEIIRYTQIQGISIFFNTVDYRSAHIHQEWELIWVLNHSLCVNCGTEKYVLGQGEMILLNPKEPHELHKENESATILCMQISTELLPELSQIYVDGKLLHLYLTEAEMEEVKFEMQKMMESYLLKEAFFSLECRGHSYLLLHKLLRRLPSHVLTMEEKESIDKRNARLNRLISYVEKNYMNKIRLTDFAEQENCSVSYLSRFIKKTLNQNFQEYVTAVRFHYACQLIATGKKKLLDVCIESGFSDYRYFSREFQKQYQMTPEEYRNDAKHFELERTEVIHSLHSAERFYSREESKELLEKYCTILG